MAVRRAAAEAPSVSVTVASTVRLRVVGKRVWGGERAYSERTGGQ
jgi:hypothetical protein